MSYGSGPIREEASLSFFDKLVEMKRGVTTWSEDHEKSARLVMALLVIAALAAIVVPIMNHYGFAHCGQQMANWWHHEVVPFFQNNSDILLKGMLPIVGGMIVIFALYIHGTHIKEAIEARYLKWHIGYLEGKKLGLEVSVSHDTEEALKPQIADLTQKIAHERQKLGQILSHKKEGKALAYDREAAKYDDVMRARTEEKRGLQTKNKYQTKRDDLYLKAEEARRLAKSLRDDGFTDSLGKNEIETL